MTNLFIEQIKSKLLLQNNNDNNNNDNNYNDRPQIVSPVIMNMKSEYYPTAPPQQTPPLSSYYRGEVEIHAMTHSQDQQDFDVPVAYVALAAPLHHNK